MNKGPNLLIMTLILAIFASSLVIASPQRDFLQETIKMKLHEFEEQILSLSPSYDLSDTFNVHSDSIAGLDSGRVHVEQYMNGFKEDINELNNEINDIESKAQIIKNDILNSQINQDNTIKTASEQAKIASIDVLNKYQSDKVDVAETKYEDNVPIQKDIFTHSRELYKDINNPDSFGILPI